MASIGGFQLVFLTRDCMISSMLWAFEQLNHPETGAYLILCHSSQQSIMVIVNFLRLYVWKMFAVTKASKAKRGNQPTRSGKNKKQLWENVVNVEFNINPLQKKVLLNSYKQNCLSYTNKLNTRPLQLIEEDLASNVFITSAKLRPERVFS